MLLPTKRVVVIFYHDKKTNMERVSHGVNTSDLSNVVLPDVDAYSFKKLYCIYDTITGEWLLK